jgi:hypothetical protein
MGLPTLDVDALRPVDDAFFIIAGTSRDNVAASGVTHGLPRDIVGSSGPGIAPFWGNVDVPASNAPGQSRNTAAGGVATAARQGSAGAASP